MIYLFFNIIMYFFINMVIVWLFKEKINVFTFIIIIFHLNLSFYFIYNDINFIYFLLFSIFSILIYQIFFYYKNKSNNEIILIKDGNIIFNNLLKYYSYNKLLTNLKLRNIKLDEISFGILKDNHLVIIKDQIIKNYPVSIIINGNILEENLKLLRKNTYWLKDELAKKEINISNVHYAYYMKNKIYFINN